jgi:hypothetical protein
MGTSGAFNPRTLDVNDEPAGRISGLLTARESVLLRCGVSTRPVQLFIAAAEQGNQIQFVIGTLLAAQLLVVDPQVFVWNRRLGIASHRGAVPVSGGGRRIPCACAASSASAISMASDSNVSLHACPYLFR